MAIAQVMEFSDPRFAPVASDEFGRNAFIRVAIPPGPEMLWPAILQVAKRGAFTALDVSRPLNIAPQGVEAYLSRLRAAGMVAIAGETTERRTLFTLATRRILPPFVDHKGEEHHTFAVTDRVWRGMKMIKRFTLSLLTAHLHDAAFLIPRETVGRYVQALAEAGYLDELGAERALGEKRYQLKSHMADGRLPPRLMRATLVFDPNRNAVAGHLVKAEEVRL